MAKSLEVASPVSIVEPASEENVGASEEVRSNKKGRKRVRIITVKKKGLRKNAPNTSIDDIIEIACCKKLCLTKFSKTTLHQIRDRFSSIAYDEQNVYLMGLIIRKVTKKSSGHKRKQNPKTSKNGKKIGRPPAEESSYSVEYNVRNEKGFNVKVCQKAFFLIHGFGKKRLEILRRKVSAGSLLPEPDRRGKHENRPQKVSEELHQQVRNHIISFPARQSHYSRHKNSNRKYLSADLSIERMYQLFLAKHNPEYLEFMKEKEASDTTDSLEMKPIVSKHYYHDIFVNEFNIHFGYPRSDTCDTCDRLKLAIAETSADVQELQNDLDDHLKAAQEGYDCLRKDIALCKDSWKSISTH